MIRTCIKCDEFQIIFDLEDEVHVHTCTCIVMELLKNWRIGEFSLLKFVMSWILLQKNLMSARDMNFFRNVTISVQVHV